METRTGISVQLCWVQRRGIHNTPSALEIVSCQSTPGCEMSSDVSAEMQTPDTECLKEQRKTP